MALTAAQVALLDKFYQSQPALNVPGKPTADQSLPLGSIIDAMLTQIADLEARVAALETP